MPDISELTIRLATPRAPHGCWDLVLTSSTGPAERTAMPLPMTSWTRTRWSTRTPFRVNGTVMRFRAVLSDDSAPSGLWLDDIESHLRAGRPLRILVHQATDRDGFVPVGEIGLSTLLTDTAIDFDPETNRPADVEPCPLWRRIR